MSISNTTLYVDLYPTYNSFTPSTYLSPSNLLNKLADFVDLTHLQKESLHQVRDFSEAHNFTITNYDIFKVADPSKALEILATRLLVKIYSDLIAPTTDFITNFLNNMWEIHQATNANKDFLALENLHESHEEKIKKGLKAIKLLIDQECYAWSSFFTFSNKHSIESYLNTIKHFLLTLSLLRAYSSNPERSEAFLAILRQFEDTETKVRTFFPQFEEICSKILKKTTFSGSTDSELAFYFDFSDARAQLLNNAMFIQNQLIPAAFEGINKALRIIQGKESLLEL